MNISSVRLLMTFIFILLFTIIPLPNVIHSFRPPLLLLFVFYIQLLCPQYFSIFALFIIGILMDVLLCTVVGQHAFALLLASWVASGKARRFNFFTIGQQMMFIGTFSLVYQMALYGTHALFKDQVSIFLLFIQPCMALLCWPWFTLLAQHFLFTRKKQLMC